MGKQTQDKAAQHSPICLSSPVHILLPLALLLLNISNSIALLESSGIWSADHIFEMYF